MTGQEQDRERIQHVPQRALQIESVDLGHAQFDDDAARLVAPAGAQKGHRR